MGDGICSLTLLKYGCGWVERERVMEGRWLVLSVSLVLNFGQVK